MFSDRNVKLFFRPHNIKMLPLGAKELTGWLRVFAALAERTRVQFLAPTTICNVSPRGSRSHQRTIAES